MSVTIRRAIAVGNCVLMCAFLTSCANLSGTIDCPATAYPGEELGDAISVEVANSGDATAREFFVDLVVSSDTAAPIAYAPYTPVFQEDGLLQGGREFVSALAPGATAAVELNGNNKIPADTPAGSRYIGLVVDSGRAVAETSEVDNVAFCAIEITACSPVADITDARIVEASGGTVGFARLLIAWSYGAGEIPASLSITVFRFQAGSWDNIMPSETPFVVADPSTTQADVIIFRLFSGSYRIQLDAGYSCGRSEVFTFERTI